MIDINFILHTYSLKEKKLVAPPVGSGFELKLQWLPKQGDVLHIHKNLLPPYYNTGGSERNDIAINSGENSEIYKDTVSFTIAENTFDPRDSNIYIITAEKQSITLLVHVRRY